VEGPDHPVGRVSAALLGAAAAVAIGAFLGGTGSSRQVPAAGGRDRELVPPAARRGYLLPPPVRARRARRTFDASVRHALPDLVDLLRLATTAGLSLPMAQGVVAPHTVEPLRSALLSADASAARGRPRADAVIESLTPLGERATAVAHLLADHLRYGVPLLPGLERMSVELRLDRRLAAEVAARRVPVRLLAPLVSCVLPAFALLTVVPLLAASLESLPL
jgi:tight adherence protein C